MMLHMLRKRQISIKITLSSKKTSILSRFSNQFVYSPTYGNKPSVISAFFEFFLAIFRLFHPYYTYFLLVPQGVVPFLSLFYKYVIGILKNF